MRAFFSPTLLYDGLLQCVTIFSASHSNRFYVPGSFPSSEYQVLFRLCAICVHMMYFDAPLCLTHWQGMDWLLISCEVGVRCVCGPSEC